jgi:hypothetical protein
VTIVDVVAGVCLALYVMRATRRPANPERTAGMIAQMRGVASSPAVAIVAAGATLANPGGFIPLALKEISELDGQGHRRVHPLTGGRRAPAWGARLPRGKRAGHLVAPTRP